LNHKAVNPYHLPLAKPISHAKRLAKTKGMSREQWLQVRKQGIGSSDAAAACGLNPHVDAGTMDD
jgi:hypothetical protein